MDNQTPKDNKPYVNRQDFKLVTNPNASVEDYGWTEDYVEDLIWISEYEPTNECMKDHEILNDLGIIFSDAIGTERNMDKAIKYYEEAIKLDDDLARSNLADIYRKGSHGVPVNQEKAFELYKECKLPYAYYRVGESYELGRGVEKDLEKAKQYYRVAYEAGHGLARRKLQTFNFLQ